MNVRIVWKSNLLDLGRELNRTQLVTGNAQEDVLNKGRI